MNLRQGVVMLFACGLGLFVGCLGDGSSSNCQPGTEFCGCSLGLCQPGLECVGNICISSDPDGGETFATTATIGDGDGDGETTAGDGDGAPPGDGDGMPGDGDGDGDGTPGDGDGDGTPGDGDGDDTGCPPGEFGCPCDAGQCAPGLACIDGICQLGGGDGDGDGDGGIDPWDPDWCTPPGMPVMIQGIAGTFCSDPCIVDADCPPGPVSTQPACALTNGVDPDPALCALVCTPNQSTCPPGSSCKQVPNQPGIGLCTYP